MTDVEIVLEIQKYAPDFKLEIVADKSYEILVRAKCSIKGEELELTERVKLLENCLRSIKAKCA